MRYEVKTNRLKWDEGTVLSADELAGCNIEAWLIGGHIAPATDTQAYSKSKRTPVEPVADDTAEEPEEQE